MPHTKVFGTGTYPVMSFPQWQALLPPGITTCVECLFAGGWLLCARSRASVQKLQKFRDVATPFCCSHPRSLCQRRDTEVLGSVPVVVETSPGTVWCQVGLCGSFRTVRSQVGRRGSNVLPHHARNGHMLHVQRPDTVPLTTICRISSTIALFMPLVLSENFMQSGSGHPVIPVTTTFEQGNLKTGGRDNIHCTAGDQSISMTCKLTESVNLLCMLFATIGYMDDLRLETLGIARGCSPAQVNCVLPPRDDLSNPAQLRADPPGEGNLTLKEEERNFKRVFQRRKELPHREPAC